MSAEEQDQKEVMSMVETILVQFDSTIRAQQEMNQQMNRRTSRIVFLGSLAIISLFAAIAFLSWSLIQNIDTMSSYMKKTAVEVAAMNNTISQTQISMNAMHSGISQIVSHTRALGDSTTQSDNSSEVLLHIADSVKLMQTETSSVNKNISNLNYNLSSINKQIKNLNRSLRVMTQDVNRMPSPTKMFPF